MNQTVPAKLSRLLLYLSFGFSALFVVLARIYTISCSDILIMYTAWPEVIEILINILECVIYGIAYAFLIYAAYRFPEVGVAKFVWIYTASVLFKYISNYIVTWMTDTGMSADYLIENLTYILIYAAMELAQMGLVLLIVWRTMKSYHAFVARQARIAANLPGVEVNSSFKWNKFEFISNKNKKQKNGFSVFIQNKTKKKASLIFFFSFFFCIFFRRQRT